MTLSIVPEKARMKYSSADASGTFPVQVSAFCNDIGRAVNPYIILDSTDQMFNLTLSIMTFEPIINMIIILIGTSR